MNQEVLERKLDAAYGLLMAVETPGWMYTYDNWKNRVTQWKEDYLLTKEELFREDSE